MAAKGTIEMALEMKLRNAFPTCLFSPCLFTPCLFSVHCLPVPFLPVPFHPRAFSPHLSSMSFPTVQLQVIKSVKTLITPKAVTKIPTTSGRPTPLLPSTHPTS